MKNRRKKRQHILNRRTMDRAPARLVRSAEDQAWLEIHPVGREFGSKDFEKYVWTSDGTVQLKP
jgi:hypothetical protein